MACATYFLPSWLLLATVCAKISMPGPYDLHIEIRAARVVPDSNIVFRHATEGNLAAIMELFDAGAASAYDVDESNGTSALVVRTSFFLSEPFHQKR